eukprot:68346-Lingulodinium_polyedra.AAC.1
MTGARVQCASVRFASRCGRGRLQHASSTQAAPKQYPKQHPSSTQAVPKQHPGSTRAALKQLTSSSK